MSYSHFLSGSIFDDPSPAPAESMIDVAPAGLAVPAARAASGRCSWRLQAAGQIVMANKC